MKTIIERKPANVIISRDYSGNISIEIYSDAREAVERRGEIIDNQYQETYLEAKNFLVFPANSVDLKFE